MFLRLTITFLFIFMTPIVPRAQTLLNLSKGTTVVPKFNRHVIDSKFSVWTGMKNTVQIEQSSDGKLSLNGSNDWKGIPLMYEFQFDKVESKKEYTEVALKSNRVHLILRFGKMTGDIEKALQEVVFVGSISAFEKSEYFKKDVIDVVFPTIFRGPLSKLGADAQLELVRDVGYDRDSISTTEYKGDQYLAIRTTIDVEYNTLQVNQAERTSQVIEQKMLSRLRTTYKKIGRLEGLKGIKLFCKVGYRNFVETLSKTQYDELELFAPLEEIAKFDDAAITSQDLVDKSIVLVNSNRVRVSLTQFSH